MCGICGNFNLLKNHKINIDILKKMIFLMKHRGPEEFGIYQDKQIGLGHARLSIIDLKGGTQPIHNEDKTVWIVYNGEVYNFPELKEGLIKKGHQFYTRTDTEVIVHLYEEKGPEFLNDLNGQFAFAIWDIKKRQLMLARDRMGIRPLFYSIVDGSLIFASEIKSIFIDKRIKREIDPYGLDQLFTFWATLPSKTIFKNIFELPPAHYLIAKNGNVSTKQYWDLQFTFKEEKPLFQEEYYAENLLSLIKDAVKLRLRADVPVASYLSGGIDSSFITALVKKYFNNELKTFSIGFADKNYNEGPFQKQMVNFLKTDHKEIMCDYADIGKIMQDIIWHAEKPLIRTAPAPLFLLSRLVQKNNIKVVLTGEGADEILAGYDIFREMEIRRFWAKYPDSKFRHLLLKKLYHYLPNWPRKASGFLKSFYKANLLEEDKIYYSHIPRWNTMTQVKSFFSASLNNQVKNHNAIDDFGNTIPENFSSWDYLSQAQYIEITTLLSGNLLSSQGDRMMMAHSVEGRFPYLDHRVIEFCAKIPANLRLKTLNEKYILKKIAKPFLPPAISGRIKQGYRAPDSLSFFNETKLDYVEDLLSIKNIKKTGYFNPVAVNNLVKRCKNTDNSLISIRHNMAIVGIITTQLLDNLFIKNFNPKINTDTMNIVYKN